MRHLQRALIQHRPLRQSLIASLTAGVALTLTIGIAPAASAGVGDYCVNKFCSRISNSSTAQVTIANQWCGDDFTKDTNDPPCGKDALTGSLAPGETSYQNDNNSDWDALYVAPGTAMSYDIYEWHFDPLPWKSGYRLVGGGFQDLRNSPTGRWVRIEGLQLFDVRQVTQTDPGPDPEPPITQPSACQPPSSWPSAKSHVNFFADAPARSGPYNGCDQVGSSYSRTNPQYVYCRSLGDDVSDSDGNHNHWWLWTDLDTGGRGWISAYYIQGQGNDEANDMNTGQPIPNC
jgi:hypothetical protein